MPSLLYVGNVQPGMGGGGAIILLRHLQYLAAQGWKITVVTPHEPEALLRLEPCWSVLPYPRRQVWWPPFRPRWPKLSRVRDLLVFRALRRAGLNTKELDVVLTICWGMSQSLAAVIAERQARPLVVIVHDFWGEAPSAADSLVSPGVCLKATRILVVSEEMKTALERFGMKKVLVIPPVPAHRTMPFVSWQERFSAPVIAHVGTLHPYHRPYLVMIARLARVHGGRVLVLCPDDNSVLPGLKTDIPDLEHLSFMPSNEEAVRAIAARASALTVMYGDADASAHPPTGFPSRFVEFVQLGLPILLSASRQNPLVSWARRQAWTARFSPHDEATAAKMVNGLTRQVTWEALANESRSAAESVFDPANIHRQFLSAVHP